MDFDDIWVLVCVLFLGMLLGGFIQYAHDLSPKYSCVDNQLHERLDGSRDVYISRNLACLKAK